MKLLDAIKEKGNPFWIPNATRDLLPQFFADLGFKRGIEIGVAEGDNLKLYCEAGFEMYGVDPWGITDDFSHRGYPLVEEYEEVVELFSKYPNCTLIRKTSVEAVKDFPDRYFDFAYIDGDHSFGNVAMDLMKWIHKVRRYGIIAGHDYYVANNHSKPHQNVSRVYTERRNLRFVPAVVNAFVECYDIGKFYVLGRRDEEREKGEICDTYFSFFFFKSW